MILSLDALFHSFKMKHQTFQWMLDAKKRFFLKAGCNIFSVMFFIKKSFKQNQDKQLWKNVGGAGWGVSVSFHW